MATGGPRLAAPAGDRYDGLTGVTCCQRLETAMLYLVYLEDIDDNAGIRESRLDEHMAHIGAYIDRIRLAGPLLRADGQRQAGGIVLIEANSANEVRDIVHADPYFKAGLWPEIRIHAFKEIINAWKPAD